MWLRDARERWHRSGQGLRRGILLGLRETAKSIVAGPELACGSDSRPCRNNAVSRSPSSNHPSSAAARPDATFLWRPSTTSTSQNLKKNPRRSPCPERCLLPLASLNHIHLTKPQKHPQLHPLPEQCHLPLASLDHIPPNETSNVSPPASNAKSRRQKNLSHRHETPAFSFPGLPKKNKMYYTY